jgi:hypothetical protein
MDLDARRPVWLALSELYLDTDYRSSVRGIARELAASPYSRDDLHSILRNEVHPVLARNLCITAGVWDGFDQDWLGQQILRNERRGLWRGRPWCSRRLLRHFWDLLEPRIRRQRDDDPATDHQGH